jgi:hypothetical protein
VVATRSGATAGPADPPAVRGVVPDPAAAVARDSPFGGAVVGHAAAMTDQQDDPPTGFPEPPAAHEPGNRSHDPDPHHALNAPAGEPDPTEWPDPYDRREDPAAPPPDPFREDVPHVPPGTTSTSAPHPDDDVQASHIQPPDPDRADS